MKYLLIFSSLLLMSCSTFLESSIPCPGEPIPGYFLAGQVTDDLIDVGYSSYEVSLAFDIFEELWTEAYPDDVEVSNSLHYLCIVWKQDSWTDPNLADPSGKLYSIAGQTFNQRDIHVWIGGGETFGFSLGRTALFHEIVHAVLWRQGFFSGDPDHQGDTYKGWTDDHNDLIRAMNARVIEEGI